MRTPNMDELLVGSSPRRYICEVHRELYDVIDQNGINGEKQKCLDLLAEAYWMGKRMSERLKDFKKEWTADEDWEDNLDYEDDLAARAARMNLLRNIKSVSIETIDHCNRKCEWCPNKDRETSPDSLMDMDVLHRILRQLLEYQYKGDIHPFLRGEPTLDKRLLQIIMTIRAYLPENYIRIVTNGAGLNKGRAETLFAAGLNSIHLNHYDGPLSGIGKSRDADFTGMSHFGMKALLPTFNNRAGKVDRTPAKQAKQCDNLLHKLVFNVKGDVLLCCNDWEGEVVFGNIMEQPISIILASQKYRDYYYAHREGRAKEMPLCRECNVI